MHQRQGSIRTFNRPSQASIKEVAFKYVACANTYMQQTHDHVGNMHIHQQRSPMSINIHTCEKIVISHIKKVQIYASSRPAPLYETDRCSSRETSVLICGDSQLSYEKECQIVLEIIANSTCRQVPHLFQNNGHIWVNEKRIHSYVNKTFSMHVIPP